MSDMKSTPPEDSRPQEASRSFVIKIFLLDAAILMLLAFVLHSDAIHRENGRERAYSDHTYNESVEDHLVRRKRLIRAHEEAQRHSGDNFVEFFELEPSGSELQGDELSE